MVSLETGGSQGEEPTELSQRALDYLVATKRLPTRRIGGRVLIAVSDRTTPALTIPNGLRVEHSAQYYKKDVVLGSKLSSLFWTQYSLRS